MTATAMCKSIRFRLLLVPLFVTSMAIAILGQALPVEAG